jgi:hypothetical protein
VAHSQRLDFSDRPNSEGDEMTQEETRLVAFLREAAQIKRECELAARLTGENFNVFKILNLQAAEVRTHSAFIAELLDPNGCHGQGSRFLQLFLKHIDLSAHGFDLNTAVVRPELPIGPVDYEKATGGQIDIVLADKNNQHILIENKINAGDQRLQLRRYHNYDTKAKLLYLTLDGRPASEESTGDDRFPKLKYDSISYRNHIVNWLDDCLKAAVSLPVIRESIFQYKCLIQELTQQTTGDKVKTKAKELILANPDLADAVVTLGETWQEILQKVTVDFDELSKKITEEIPISDEVTIRRFMPNDCGGVVVAFRARMTAKDDPAPAAQRYAECLRRIVAAGVAAGANGDYGRTNYWNVGWFWPLGFRCGGGLECLPKPQIIDFYKERKELEAFVAKIEKRAKEVTTALCAELSPCLEPQRPPT